MDTTNYLRDWGMAEDFSDFVTFSSISTDHDEQLVSTTGEGACEVTEVIGGLPSSHTTFHQLAEPIMPKVKEIEQKRTKHHKESFTFIEFVRLLIYYFCGKVDSGRQLITSLQSEEEILGLVAVPRSTFFYAFDRFPAEWFKSLFTTILSQISWKSIPELDLLGQLQLCDGSIFPLPRNIEWAEYKSNSQALKLHICFNLNQMIPVQIEVGTANSSERDALRTFLQKGVTYIADRGYVCFTLLADIVQAQAFFAIRMYCNLDYTIVEPLSIDLPSTVKHIFELVTDQKVKLNGAQGEPIYRLVTFWVGDEKYFILTNRFDLSTFQIILLYAYRWQVELVIRFLKRTMNGLHLLSMSQNGVQIHFYMLLCSALLQLHLKQKSLEQSKLPPSPLTGDHVFSEVNIDENQSPPEPFFTSTNQQNNGKSNVTAKANDGKQAGSLDCSNKSTDSGSNQPRLQQVLPDCKQTCAFIDQSLLNQNLPANQSDPNQPIKIAGLMIDTDQLVGTRGQTFLATIGSKLDRYWKISVHWLVKLRNHLHKPFTPRIMASLADP